MGRKPKQPADHKAYQIGFRLARPEWDRLAARAAADARPGYPAPSPSEAARAIVIRALDNNGK